MESVIGAIHGLFMEKNEIWRAFRQAYLSYPGLHNCCAETDVMRWSFSPKTVLHVKNHPPALHHTSKAPSHAFFASYSSSLTCPSNVVFPRVTAMCIIMVPSSAPCQCRVPAGQTTKSPARIRCGFPPASHTQPEPSFTSSICPFSCVCQYVRPPGRNVTWLTKSPFAVSKCTRSWYTSPVKLLPALTVDGVDGSVVEAVVLRMMLHIGDMMTFLC